jgi:hypothetical protein
MEVHDRTNCNEIPESPEMPIRERGILLSFRYALQAIAALQK